MTTEDIMALANAVTDTDAALARLQDVVRQISDGDLHRAHTGGGWSVAQVISHINLATVLWTGDVARLAADPALRFFFREEIGHDALGYPPPTTAIALRQLDSTRRTLASCLLVVPEEIMGRTVEIPDLGTMTIAEWTPLILGHVTGHVDQAADILRDRGALPKGA